MLRSHTCGELRPSHIGSSVRLGGWIARVRDHGGLIFLDLRDRYGVTQVVVDPRVSASSHELAERLGRETCVLVAGNVRERSDDTVNPAVPTGDIEVVAEDLRCLAASRVPPFHVEEAGTLAPETRLRYRFLDLRREWSQHALQRRSDAALAIRNTLADLSFTEIETPFLVRSTPEGARDFIVPSRTEPGAFFALPQSPQLYKQLLMVSGCDRYYQIVRCFRDEDLRQDRQPEFTQLDLEMSFAEEEDVMDVTEAAIAAASRACTDGDVPRPFPRIPHAEALDRFGTDKPDLRYGLELIDISDLIRESSFDIVKGVVEGGGVAKIIVAPFALSRTYLNDLIAFAQGLGAAGLAYIRVDDAGSALEGTLAKLFPSEVQQRLIANVGATPGSFLLIVSGPRATTDQVLGAVRTRLAADFLDLSDAPPAFVWITDFPLFEPDPASGRPVPAHHPFTSPEAGEDLEDVDDPFEIGSRSYDLVLNGVELGSGSVRIHEPRLQARVLRMLGMEREAVERDFGFLLEALEYGPPPHAGIAVGFDRLTALLLGTQDIREVIAFPKSRSGESLVDGAPAPVSEEQLVALGLELGPEFGRIR
jgi:aspartyl-tRNA synthetase